MQADSPRSNSSRWIYFLLPSALDIFFITLLLGLSCGALGRLLLRDADIGWHIRNGQQILATHAVPRSDPFSSSMAGKPWFAWEWLYDAVIAAIHHVFGLNGVVFYTAAIIAVTFVLALHVGLKRGGNLPVTLLLLIVSLGAAAVHFLARPHVVSWLFTVIWFDVLDSATESRDNRLYWLPVLMIFWVNLHGGFVLGFALLFVYLAAGSLEYLLHMDQRQQKGRWLKKVGAVFGVCFVASFVNPYGYQLHLHVYRYLSDRFLMDRISEFLSPDFHGAAQQCFAILLMIALTALATARRRPTLALMGVILFAAYAGFYATRNLPTSSLLITLIVAPVLSRTLAEAGESPDMSSWVRSLFSWMHAFSTRVGNMEMKLEGHLWLVLVFVLGMWACAHQGRVGQTQFINAYFDSKRFPVEAADVIAKRGIHEPILCVDYWGGYLIYRLYPETKVVADDRHDFYGDQFFKDFLRIMLVQPDWNETLDKLHVSLVLVPTESSLANILRMMPGWEASYQDRTAVLFSRKL